MISLGFSPCPNDTFIFDALVNNKIDTDRLEFEVVMEDVETLNQLALKQELDITKISYGVLPLLMKNYIVLNSGSALGTGVGPLLVSKNKIDLKEIGNCTVAIPGEHTTAHLLFNIAFPDAKNKIFLRYDQIEEFVLQVSLKGGDLEGAGATAGVIIHENRFTYEKKGLVKLLDLGEYWQQKTTLPIPLGGIVGKKSLDQNLLRKLDALIQQSIRYSFDHYPELSDFIKNNAMEMEEEVMRKHIDLYVNNFSISLGEDGRNAVRKLLNTDPEFLEVKGEKSER